jgi:hypothetical protein
MQEETARRIGLGMVQVYWPACSDGSAVGSVARRAPGFSRIPKEPARRISLGMEVYWPACSDGECCRERGSPCPRKGVRQGARILLSP